MKYVALLTLMSTMLVSTISGAEIRVANGESIQDAVDAANSGDTIIVEPGTYQNENANTTYGVHITKSNIRLIGEPTSSDKVILKFLPDSAQKIGIFVAPPNCEFNSSAIVGPCDGSTLVSDIDIVGMTVENFPFNGIQTRRVDKFKILQCNSVNNIVNGIYPTISTNGLLQDNFASGSVDTAMWPTGCENILVTGNTLFDSLIGLEITVSNNIVVRNNTIYNNTVGVELAHPGFTLTPTRPVMKNWTIEDNVIYDNNKPNNGRPGKIESSLPTGLGVLLIGVSDHIVRKNTIRDNGTAGLAIVGYCTALELAGKSCSDELPLEADPSANNNFISFNKFKNNGMDQDPLIGDQGLPGVDLLYIQSPSLNETGDGNCFEFKIKTTYIAIVDGEPSGTLGQNLPNGCGVIPGFFRRFLNRILTLPKIIYRLLF